MRKKVIIALLILCLLGGGYYYFFLRKSAPTSTVMSTKVMSGSIRSVIKVTGNIFPLQQTSLTFAKQGTLKKILKKEGDVVKAGEVIAEVDAKSTLLDIESAKVALANAKNNYATLFESVTDTDRIRSENTLLESKKKLPLLQKSLENLLQEQKNSIISTEATLSTLNDTVSIAQGEYDYARRNILIDTTSNTIQRDTENAFLLIEDIATMMPDIIFGTRDILHIEDRSNSLYGDLSANNITYKYEAERAYSGLIDDFSAYKAELLSLRSGSERSFSGTYMLLSHAKIFLDTYVTLVGSTMISEIDASPETQSFQKSLHDSYKSTLRGYSNTLNSKLNSINSSISTLKSYGSESLQALADSNTLSTKKLALTNAQNDLATALSSFEQTKKTYAEKILSAESDIEAQKNSIRLNEASNTDMINGPKSSEVTSAKNSIHSAEINLEKANIALRDYQVIATFDGTVRNIPWILGDTTLATQGVLVENVDTCEIKLSLDQIDIVKVRPGMRAKVVLDAFPKNTYTGSIMKISAVPTVTSGVVSYEADVVLSISGSDVYSNMSATIEIIIAEKQNTLLVPTAATVSQNGKTYVNVAIGNSTTSTASEKREVVLGLSENGRTEILSGLTLGERVVSTFAASSGSTSSTSSTSTRRASSLGGPPPF